MSLEIKPGSDLEKEYDRIDKQGQLESHEIRRQIGAPLVMKTLGEVEASHLPRSERAARKPKYPRSRKGLSGLALVIADRDRNLRDQRSREDVPSESDSIEIGAEQAQELEEALERGRVARSEKS